MADTTEVVHTKSALAFLEKFTVGLTGFLQVEAITPKMFEGDKPDIKRKTVSIDNIDDLAGFVEEHQNRNLHFTFLKNSQGSGADGAACRDDITGCYYQVNLIATDPPEGATLDEQHTHLAKEHERLCRRVDAFRLVPTFVIDTGDGGLQCFWEADKPVSVAEVEAVNKRLCRHFKASDACWRARLPYTTNWPGYVELAKGRTAVESCLIEQNDNVYGPVAFRFLTAKAGTAGLQPFPGDMLDAVQACLEVARKPQPEMAIGAALSGMAAACGSFYKLEDGTRLNAYILCIAKTGLGKDKPLKLAEKIGKLAQAKLIDAPGSGQGLEDVLVSNIATYCVADEIAHFFSVNNEEKAAPYLRENNRKILALYSAGSGEVRQRALAGKEPNTIPHPAFNLFGVTTPEKFGTAFTPDNFADGLAGRISYVFTDSNPAIRRIKKELTLPDSFKAKALKISKKAVFMMLMDGITVHVTDAADAIIDGLTQEFDQHSRVENSPYESAVCMRSMERTERIAGVLAVWDNPDKPVIDVAHIQWAAQFVRASNTMLLRLINQYMQPPGEQADAARLMAMLDRGGFKGRNANEVAALKEGFVPRTTLMRLSNLRKKAFDAAIDYLVGRDDLAQSSYGNKGMRVLGLPGED
ncbi:YfjI family protein [Pseudomonas sp. LS1212]|uniref:YfjI family protein n=1 Tax=Pseudomonas sp. LS1212 TaxID=2972478 RepID=UPI00215C2359|nr:YfjI family protein [Pseudomonas sp. LS1212]UVJ42851.1 YfjI family protein [Pseudomonas sp. LS1212]